MSSRLQTRLLAALMLLPLLVLGTATGSFGLRCTMTGQMLPACCCESAGPPADTIPTTISQAGCCDRVTTEVAVQDAEVDPSAGVTPEHARVAVTAEVAFAFASVVRPPRPVARAALGPPTGRLRLLAKSTFLI